MTTKSSKSAKSSKSSKSSRPLAASLLPGLAWGGGLIGCAVLICIVYVLVAGKLGGGWDEQLAECRMHLAAGNFAAAEQRLRQLHAQDPLQMEVVELLAEGALRQRDLPVALDWLEKVPTTDPQRAAIARYRGAQLAMELAEASRCERLSLEALRLWPSFAEPRKMLVRYSFLLLQHRPLQEYSTQLDAQGQLSVIDLVMRCIAARAAWDDDDHLRWLQQCLHRDPKHGAVRAALAHHYSRRDRQAEAAKLLQEAPSDSLDAWRLQLAAAELATADGRYEQAGRLLAALPDEADAEARTWLARGRVWQELQAPAAAQLAWQNTVLLDPYDPAPPFALSRFESGRSDAAAANPFYTRSQQLKDFMGSLARLMEATNPAYQSLEPVENTLRLAADQAAGLGFPREAEILAAAISQPHLLASIPASAQSLPLPPLSQLHALSAIAGQPKLSPPGELAGGSTSREAVPTVRWRDVAAEIGLSFQYDTGRSPFRWIIETLGGGAGVLDYDLDGWDDLFLTQAGPLPTTPQSTSATDRLFRNRLGARADDVTAAAGLQDWAYGQGCAVGDFDEDGFPDLAVANYDRFLLWHNNGDGTFAEVTESAGILDQEWSSSAAFSDLDRDGDLDLYVVHYLAAQLETLRPCKLQGAYTSCRPFDYAGVQDLLWENQGNGTFRNATAERGLQADQGKGLGVMIADFHRTGREAIFVANDTTPNFLFQQNETGKFMESAVASGVAVGGDGLPEASMGIACGDVDRDGIFDLLITTFQGETNTLYRGLPGGDFTDDTERAGLAASSRDRLGFGCQFVDLDANGDLDLFIANGHLHERPQLPQLYYNLGGGRFREISATAGDYFRQPKLGRSVAILDWNRDLLADLAVTYQVEPTSVLLNETAAGHRVQFQLIGRGSNRDAIGAVVRARVAGRDAYYHVTRSGGYYAANRPQLLIGCGQATQIDELEIAWPSGVRTSFQSVPADRRYVLLEGAHEWHVCPD